MIYNKMYNNQSHLGLLPKEIRFSYNDYLMNFLLRGKTYIDRRKDYSKWQNSFYMFYITEKMRGKKIAAEVERAVKKKQSCREGRGSGRLIN